MTTYEDGLLDGALREAVREHDRRLNRINGSIDDTGAELASLRSDVNEFRSKLKVWGIVAVALLGLVSPVVTGVVVWSLTHSPT